MMTLKAGASSFRVHGGSGPVTTSDSQGQQGASWLPVQKGNTIKYNIYSHIVQDYLLKYT